LLFLLNFFFAKVTSPLETKKELTESLVFFSVARLDREIGCFFQKMAFFGIFGGLNVHPHTIYGAPINALEA
jgi:hypothetical protein